MSIPSNGITPEVIRQVMPPYHLSADLLEATLAAIPAPTPDAPKTWRLAGLTRLVDEIAAPKPAIAEQALPAIIKWAGAHFNLAAAAYRITRPSRVMTAGVGKPRASSMQ